MKNSQNPSAKMTLPLLQAFPPTLKGVNGIFTTRVGGQSPPPFAELNLGFSSGDDPTVIEENWKTLLPQIGASFEQLKIPKLEHTSTLCQASDCGPFGQTIVADALYTQNPNEVLAVTAADCLPILIYDPDHKTVAAVHAGWRGTADKILEKTLLTLFAQKLLLKKSTFLCFGPHIHATNYAVGKDVALQFPTSCVSLRRTSGKGDTYQLDLNEANRLQALSCGVPENHIFYIPHCTFERQDQFFSYRRDGKSTGRIAAVIKLD